MVSQTSHSYMPIYLHTIKVDTISSFDVFITNKQGKIILYNAGGDRFTVKVRDKLIENNITILYIHKKDKEAYHKYIDDYLPDLLNDPNIPSSQKAEISYISISNIAKTLFANPQAQTISHFKKSISSTVDLILHDRDAIGNLIRLTSYDFSTSKHSINVGIFALGLAKELFADDKNHNMYEIASGFFLHDIGKCKIPLSILKKPGPLNDIEWKIIKNHPQEGYELLKKFNKLTMEAKVIVLQHHERFDGNGYPKGLKGDKIHLYSKICCIADVFDALTSKRTYKKALSSFKALKIMKEEMQNEFDPLFFKKFVILFSQKDITPKQEELKIY